jgi:hypothetical protein
MAAATPPPAITMARRFMVMTALTGFFFLICRVSCFRPVSLDGRTAGLGKR